MNEVFHQVGYIINAYLPTQYEILHPSHVLNVTTPDVMDLHFLPTYKYVKKLILPHFRGNLEQLIPCTQLEYLRMSSFQGDIYPLVECRNLHTLKSDWPLLDISPLIHYYSLRVVNLTLIHGMKDPLQYCIHLEAITIHSFNGSIASLAKCSNLQKLNLPEFNGDISPLSNCRNLRSIRLNKFTGTDIQPLSICTDLEELYMMRFTGSTLPLYKCKQLQVIHMPMCRFDRSTFECINLKSIQVREFQCQLFHLQHLQTIEIRDFDGALRPFRECKNLRKLLLPSCKARLRYDDPKSLHMLSNCKDLECISMGSIVDYVTPFSVYTLSSCQSIKWIYLGVSDNPCITVQLYLQLFKHIEIAIVKSLNGSHILYDLSDGQISHESCLEEWIYINLEDELLFRSLYD